MKPLLPLLLLPLLASLAPLPGQDKSAVPGPTTVKGRVVDVDGKPLAGVAIAFGQELAMVTAAVLRQPTVRTDAEGRFQHLVTPDGDQWRDQFVLHVAQKERAGLLLSRAPKYDKDQKTYATEADHGDITLIVGGRLFGRVRSPEGKPIQGVRVVARDAFGSIQSFRSRSMPLFCAALTDASGIFDLPATITQAVRLEVTMAGHYQQVLMPVSTSTPLEVTLQPSGAIAGRVLDQDGRGVVGAAVAAEYEVRGVSESTSTAADGSFRLTLQQPARYRITATRTRDKATSRGHSAVLSGPTANLEIALQAPAEKAASDGSGTMVVQAIDQQTKARVSEFTAAGCFEEYVNQNANYREFRLRQMVRSGEASKDGQATLNGPGKGGAATGVVRVVAKGFAPGTLTDYQWQDLPAGQERPPVVVELVTESTLSGKVQDEITGEPVAGARVWTRLAQDRSQGYYNEGDQIPDDAVTAAADGSYTVPGMGEGNYEVFVRHPDRPKGPSSNVEIKAREQQPGCLLKLPAGANVQGRLVNGAIGRDWKVFLFELPEFNPTAGGGGRTYYGSAYEPPGAIPIDPDGSFTFQGQKLADYRLMLMVPSPPRCGGNVFVPVEPFRLRRAGLQREFDIEKDRPGTVRGTLTFPAAAVPFDRVVITARAVADDQQNVFFNPYNNDWSGPRAFVDRGGAFELVLGPGRYALEAVDIASGIRIGTTATPLAVTAGATVQQDLAFRLLDVVVKLEPEQAGPAAVADRLEVRVAAKDQNQNVRMFGGNDNYDFGTGFALLPDQKEIRFAVPPSDLVLLLRNNVGAIRTDNQRHNLPPLSRADFEALDKPDANRAIVLKLPVPPEIPDDDTAQKGKGDNADGTADK